MKIMRKFVLFFLSILLFSQATILLILNTSCFDDSPEDPKEYKDYYEYIHKRTFSLWGLITVEDRAKLISHGTAWILNKVNNELNDFSYYVATNLHVSYPLFINPTYKLTECKYADYKDESFKSWPASIHYTTIDLADVQVINKYLTFECEDDETISEIQKMNNSIDFSILKMNFNKSASGSFKNKLIELNNFYKEKHYINKFASINPAHKVDGWCAGFPSVANEKYSVRWTKFYFNDLVLSNDAKHQIVSQQDDITLPTNIIDISPVYISNNYYPYNTFPLIGGSSGSMLINKDFEILGIYWGGYFSDELKTRFYPCFDIFHSWRKSFILKYINQ